MVAILVILTVLVFLSIQLVHEHGVRRRVRERIPGMSAYSIPDHLYLHRGHTWARLDSRGDARVGIDHFLLELLGRVDRLEFPQVGERFSQGERIFSIGQGDRRIDLLSPLGGTVTGVNGEADLNDAHLRKEPYRRGWLLAIRPHDIAGNLRDLRYAPEAARWLEAEVKRLSDFLAADPAKAHGVGATMMDGGQPMTGLLDRLDDERLRAFGREFLS